MLANALSPVQLQVAVAVGLLFGVWVLLLQVFQRCSTIVPIFFECKPQSVIFAGFSGAPCFFKLRISHFSEQFRLWNRARFVIKPRLKIGQTLRGNLGKRRKKNEHAPRRASGGPAGPHPPTSSVQARVAAPCSAPLPARLDRDFCPDPVPETSGKPPNRASAGSAYRSTFPYHNSPL